MFRGWRGPRRKLTAEEIAANQKARIARENATMTCQCCGRKHLANRGWVALHGYQRPGYGWQTASCFGAKALPFEVDRKKLGELIDFLRDLRKRKVAALTAVREERVPVTLTYSFKDYYGRARWDSNASVRNVHFKVTRATFEKVRAAEDNERIFRDHYWDNFDKVKNADVASREREIDALTRDIKEQVSRFNGWKQTHRWNAKDKTWVPL